MTVSTDPHDPVRPRKPRLGPAGLLRAAWASIASRPTRTALASLGITLGIAALVAVAGIAASNRAQLLADLDTMGANLLAVEPGQQAATDTPTGSRPFPLPHTAPAMIARIGPVDHSTVTYQVPDSVTVTRTDLLDGRQGQGIGVLGADADLPRTLQVDLVQGRWLDPDAGALPTVVLGDRAARALDAEPGQRVWIGHTWYAVVGVLNPFHAVDAFDRIAFIDPAQAEELWTRHADGRGASSGDIDAIWVRARSGRTAEVRDVLAATANPAAPARVAVSTPVDLTAVRDATSSSLDTLVLALGAVALLMGAAAIANTMVVAVTERRGEIGLRRALGARRGHIAGQFIAEAVLTSTAGAIGGVVTGAGAPFAYTTLSGQTPAWPLAALVLGPVLGVGIGAVAGAWPALKAAGLPPVVALSSR